ncbi:hypothetical protein MJN76_32660, partial [Salmonella enterica subsp. enterica serovar Anatum]|nr:hypothetical protein [Salmonella enterica subsp. enterica serovar Anatum]
NELSEEALIQILKEPKNALTKQYQALFNLEGVDLEFRDEALDVWIWLAAILGISAMNMLIGILIGCSIVSILLIFSVAPNRSVA